MLEICGSNDHFQLDEESNNKDLQYGYSAISPSKKSRLEASSISSYSSYYYQTVVITKDSKLLASGSNKDHQIIGSLANEDLKKFTKFDIKIDNDHLLYPISAVCGYNYTLYLASITKDSHEKHLFYSFAGIKSENPLFLSIGDSNPVSLFGGFSSAASIDTEGFVIFISLSSQESKPSELERNHLPNSDEAVCVACCVDFIYAVGLSGQLFESKPPKPGSSKLNFRPVESLNGVKISEVSGTYLHCFAVAEDGRVFGRGSNERGKLGIGRGTEKATEFKEISSFGNHKIKHAYAGMNHSLFQTANGQIFTCGDNRYGQLIASEPSKDPIYIPKNISIVGKPMFCVAGSDSSAVFIDHDPLNSPNRRISSEKFATISRSFSITDSSIPDSSSELSRLKIENARFREENESLRKEINELKEKNKKITLTDTDRKTKNIEILDSEDVSNLEFNEEIGYGRGGKVFRVSLKKSYALKQMNIQNASYENLQRFVCEYEIMNMLNHPNILKTHGIFFSNEKIPPSILLEFCPMNLEQAIKKNALTDIQIIFSIYQIAEGMKYIHHRKIIHRDLKPSNVLISEDGKIKICDFGISRLMTSEEQSLTKGIGTQKFMAPEMINEENYNEKVDVYSFGVLVYFIISGGELPDIKIKDICEGKTASIPSTFALLAQQLIEACWFFDPDDRPSFEMICQTLEENNFNLLPLEKKDNQEVIRIIDQYRAEIPNYLD